MRKKWRGEKIEELKGYNWFRTSFSKELTKFEQFIDAAKPKGVAME